MKGLGLIFVLWLHRAQPPLPPPASRRSRPRARHVAGDYPAGAAVAEVGAAQNDTSTNRRSRALSSPARSAAAAVGVRARSPSASPAPAPAPSPLQMPDAPEAGSAGGASGETPRAYFSPRPPAAPLWLVPLAAPPPAPLAAPLVAPLAAPLSAPLPGRQAEACVSPDTLYISPTSEKESLTDSNGIERREASMETSRHWLAGEPAGGRDRSPRRSPCRSPPLSRSTSFSMEISPPCNVAVQTHRCLKATTSADIENSSLVYNDKSLEWAGRLRDGHVRLALRALRQLRRAERLRRALCRPPPAALVAAPAHRPLMYLI